MGRAWIVGLLLSAAGCARIGNSFGDDGDGDVPDEVTDIPDDAWVRLATARCEARLRCDCAESIDLATCIDTYAAQYEEVVAGHDLQFDPACFDTLLDFHRGRGCETGGEALTQHPQCQLLAGDGAQPCTFLSGFGFGSSTCGWGRRCVDGECRDDYAFLQTVGIGQPCTVEVAPGQEPVLCDSEGYCDPVDYVCVPDVGLGQPCPDHRACTLEAYCAGPNAASPGTCQPRAAIGEPCEPGSGFHGCEIACNADDTVCDSVECVDGVCEPPPPYACLGPA